MHSQRFLQYIFNGTHISFYCLKIDNFFDLGITHDYINTIRIYNMYITIIITNKQGEAKC